MFCVSDTFKMTNNTVNWIKISFITETTDYCNESQHYLPFLTTNFYVNKSHMTKLCC